MQNVYSTWKQIVFLGKIGRIALEEFILIQGKCICSVCMQQGKCSVVLKPAVLSKKNGFYTTGFYHRPILYKIVQNNQHGYCQAMSGIF